MIGRRLGDRYDIFRRIGAGGMATVYLARCTLLQRDVAVKVLKAELVENEDFLTRFQQEARAAASLSHPNVVAIYDVGQEDGVPYIVMEYIEGPTLKELIVQQGPLPIQRAAGILSQLLSALEHAHGQGIIHRDIKPHNILLTTGGMPKVADFGIARAASGSTLELTATILGSAHYFSPEQARGGFVGEKSDIYATGVVLYEMLTGQVPFDGDTPVSIALKHLNEPVPAPSQLNPEVTPQLEAVVLRALEKDRDDRYASARDMARALSAASGGRAGDVGAPAGAAEAVPPGKGPRLQAAGDGTKQAKRSRLVFKFNWRVLAIWVLAFLLLGVSLSYAGIRVWDWWDVPVVEVPAVQGRSLEDGQRALEAVGLAGRIAGQRHHDEIPVGHIIGQDPTAGEEVRSNRVVDLFMSLGPEWVEAGVPAVQGMRVQLAEAALYNAGLKVVLDEVYDDDVSEGHVVSQNPAAGARVQKGTVITLLISLGPEPAPVRMPGFVGQPVADAQEQVEQLGLRLRIVEDYTEYPEGIVADQNPQQGQMVQTGDTVVLVVSKGGDDANSRQISIEVPAAPPQQEILVKVIDTKGERTVYRNTHPADAVFDITVHWYGDTARLRVFTDGTEIVELNQVLRAD